MQKKYFKRTCEKSIREYFKIFPVVAILGPRQSGKSTLAKEVLRDLNKKGAKTLYVDLENYEQQKIISQDPLGFFRANADSLVCLDEIQRLPEIFSTLRGVIDQKRVPGRFLILGSASPHLIKQSSESLAGRIGYIELTPFNFLEIEKQDFKTMRKHWLRGGFPDAYLAQNEQQSFAWKQNFLRNFRERDIREFSSQISPIRLQNLLVLLQSYHGHTINYSKMSASLSLSNYMGRHSVNDYLDLLEQTYILRRLKPYFRNIKKRIVKSPKIYFRDSGILHTVAQISNWTSLNAHILYGPSFEGYAIENLTAALPDWEQFFYRTSAGEEIDLILEKGKERIAVEIKISSKNINLTKSFYNALSDIKPKQTFIIVPSYGEPLFIKENIKIGSLPDIISDIRRKL